MAMNDKQSAGVTVRTRRSPYGGNYLDDTAIEIIAGQITRCPRRSALFDFDGTLSLIREGWQGVMIPMMVNILLPYARPGETEESIRRLVTDFVTRLTGKQTIYQMIELARQIEQRGGTPKDPIEYKWQYLDLLWEHIRARVEDLKAGRTKPVDLLVPGSLGILQALQERGVVMYLASGTDLPYVMDEAEALGLMPYFGDGERVFGALDDYKKFSKAMVIDDIIKRHNLHGDELLGFGDGYVEIENVRAAGGLPVGVPSDEKYRTGINEWKRRRLIEAGAAIITPDFREYESLVAYIWGES